MQINQATLDALYKGYRTQFLAAYQGAKAFWAQIAMKTTSNKAQEIYHWLGAVPGMRQLIDEIQVQNLAAHKYAITNDEFESTLGVKRADVERDSYGIYNPLMQAMGLAAAQHPDVLVAALLTGGFSTLCYTGKNFFDTNHEPQKGKTKFTNKGTSALDAAAFAAARSNIKSRKNAAGRPMGLGSDLVLVCGPLLETTAKGILQADFIQEAAKQGGNVVGGAAISNVNKGSARLEVWSQLGDSLNWYLFDAGYPIKPFIFQEELPTEFTALNKPTDDHVFKRKEFLYQAYGRYNAGYGLPELAFGSLVD